MKRRLLIVAAVAMLGASAIGGVALATSASGFAGTTIALGHFGDIASHVHTIPAWWDEQIRTKGDSDLYVQQNTWQPGGSTGWHTHPGPSFVIVTQGSVTEYDGDDPSCTPHVYTAGTANNSFVDPGDGHVHIIRNETSSVAMSIAVQLVPAGAARRIDVAPSPGNCTF